MEIESTNERQYWDVSALSVICGVEILGEKLSTPQLWSRIGAPEMTRKNLSYRFQRCSSVFENTKGHIDLTNLKETYIIFGVELSNHTI